jgi:hypothetical protein
VSTALVAVIKQVPEVSALNVPIPVLLLIAQLVAVPEVTEYVTAPEPDPVLVSVGDTVWVNALPVEGALSGEIVNASVAWFARLMIIVKDAVVAVALL